MKTYDINMVEEQLKSSESVAFFTRGASMRPLLRTHKDIVVIVKPEHPLSVNDVALYKVKGSDKLVLHRVIGIKDEVTYITRGDNTYHKEYVPKDQVVGIMTAVYRGGKYIDCKNSKGYKVYVWLNKVFYPVRWLWRTKIRATLGKIKRHIIK